MASGINDRKINAQSLLDACIGEFSGSLKLTVRQVFCQSLKNFFVSNGFNVVLDHEKSAAVPPLIKINNTHSISSEKKYLLDAIEQDLVLRDIAIGEQKSQVSYKRGVLLEGDSGAGKSTLLKLLLEKKGFSKDSLEPTKRYYEVSAGDKEIYKTLTTAFNEGSIVILDELNLDQHLEDLLNQFLSGVDLLGNKAEREGFMVFASQNPSSFEGRKSLSLALVNRLHALQMDSFTEVELRKIAHSVENPDAFVKAFLNAQKDFPDTINMRSFYTLLNAEMKPSQIFDQLTQLMGRVKAQNNYDQRYFNELKFQSSLMEKYLHELKHNPTKLTADFADDYPKICRMVTDGLSRFKGQAANIDPIVPSIIPMMM